MTSILGRALPFVVLAMLASGCDVTSTGEAQRLFEVQALDAPAGYTETPDGVTIRSSDPDDWRTGPLYQTRFAFTITPFPNPLTFGEAIRVQGTFSGESGALIPYRRLNNGDFVRIPAACVVGTLSGFAPTYTIEAGCLADGQSGLARLLLLDTRGNILSYGDVFITP